MAERRRCCFQTIRAFNKPQGEGGGLTHILLPTGDTIERIDTKHEMEYHLYHRNRIHFAQASTTPFACGPTATLFQHSGITDATLPVLNGDIENTPLATLPYPSH